MSDRQDRAESPLQRVQTAVNGHVEGVTGTNVPTHDPECIAWLGPDESNLGSCEVCALIKRVREDERSKTLKAASEALDVLDRWGEATYRHVVIDYDEAVAAIESLGDEDD